MNTPTESAKQMMEIEEAMEQTSDPRRTAIALYQRFSSHREEILRLAALKGARNVENDIRRRSRVITISAIVFAAAAVTATAAAVHQASKASMERHAEKVQKQCRERLEARRQEAIAATRKVVQEQRANDQDAPPLDDAADSSPRTQ